MQDF
jgi:histone H3